MKRKLTIVFGLMVTIKVFAQLSIADCQQMAHDNYPTIKRYNLIMLHRNYDVSNLSKAYLPQIKVGTTAGLFIDLLRLPIALQAVAGREMKNHLLMANVQMNQLIYDGGTVAATKRVVRRQTEAESRATDVTMYDIRSRVNELFFGILMLDAQLRRSELLQNDLALSRKTVDGMLRGGVANQSDIDAVAVEQVRAEQQTMSLRASHRAYLTMLGLFIGRELADTIVLKHPSKIREQHTISTQRPELAAFVARQRMIDAQRKVLDTQLRPKLSAFGLAAYYNRMMSLVQDKFFAAGLTLSWDITPFYTRRNDLRKLSVQQQQVDNDREIFLFNTHLLSASVNGIINDLREGLKQDDRIISFWELIYAAAARGITVFVTTHYMDEAEYCDRISIMVDGKIRAMDSPTALKQTYGCTDMDEVFTKLARQATRV